MGGEETGVTETTRNVLLEAAYFLPASVRRTARTLNLPSDASYRFERGVDPEMILRASARAARIDPRNRRRETGTQTIMVAGEIAGAAAGCFASLRKMRSTSRRHDCADRWWIEFWNDSVSKRLGAKTARRRRSELENSELSARSAARSRSDRGGRARVRDRQNRRSRSQPLHSGESQPIARYDFEAAIAATTWWRGVFPKRGPQR